MAYLFILGHHHCHWSLAPLDTFGCVEQLLNQLARDLVGFLVGKVGISRKQIEVLVVGKWGLPYAWVKP